MQRGSTGIPDQGFCNSQNPICAAGYLGSVGYTNACHLETLEALIDMLLGSNVQMSGALVQKEDSRLPIECSR